VGVLLKELQKRRTHMALVIDEHGGLTGLVTLEDLIEEIVGEIRDEFDREQPMVVQLGDGRARLDGRASVEDLMSLFGPLREVDSADYDTVSGLVYQALQRVPESGDTVERDGLELTVESVVRRACRDRPQDRGSRDEQESATEPKVACPGPRASGELDRRDLRRVGRHRHPSFLRIPQASDSPLPPSINRDQVPG
jgi:Mg2+/Co2+ transporter CorC